MKRQSILLVLAALLALCAATPAAADTVTYTGPFVLDANDQRMNWDEVWDLTKGDVTLSYHLDMSQITQPSSWPTGWIESPPGSGNWVFETTPTTDPKKYPDTFTPWIEVGMRGVGGDNYNPGPAYTYQGKCGGWMTSESDDWLGTWTLDENGKVVLVNDGAATQDGDDKHSLAATSGVGEWHYDVEDADGAFGYDAGWDAVLPMFGSHDNHGLWYDRDGVDPWQATSWENSGINAGRINTGGLYDIVITYHAIDDGLGVMFATVNGVQQGFYKPYWHSGGMTESDRYPAGLSFKGDMKQMQVFAGSWAGDPAGWDYGTVTLSDIEVTGTPGTADPLVADFTYSPTTIFTGDTVQFTDASHGGMDPYTYSWSFGDGTTSTEQNPAHTFTAAGTYTVKLTATPFRCVPKEVTKTVTVTDAGYVTATKYYDANANGEYDDGETLIPGWKVQVVDADDAVVVEGLTGDDGTVTFKVPVGTYTVCEVMPVEPCWMATTPASASVVVTSGESASVSFGNLCLGGCAGLTPGFWSNKNGQKLVGADDLAMLRALNLKDAKGRDFDPRDYAAFKKWLLGSAASDNMAYKLSSQLAAMELNVYNGIVDGTMLIHAPGTAGANALGFATVNDVMAEANAALALDGLTPAGDPNRPYQEALKDALDRANNNYNFVQPVPCPFTYA